MSRPGVGCTPEIPTSGRQKQEDQELYIEIMFVTVCVSVSLSVYMCVYVCVRESKRKRSSFVETWILTGY